MAEDFDVEAMLEAPYRKEEGRSQQTTTTSSSTSSSKSKKKKKKSRSRSKERSRRDGGREKRSRSRERDKDKERDKDRDKDKERDRERRGEHRGDRRDKARGGSKEKERAPRGREERERERERRSSPGARGRRGIGSGGGFRRSRSRDRFPRKGGSPHRGDGDYAQGGTPGLTPEERDIRTVFCMQLSAKIRAKDLEEFFSSVGQVTDVRMITDSKTRRSKGIAYIEFKDVESVPLAMALTGQRLLGVPILVQATQSERNRMAMANSLIAANKATVAGGPMRLYVGSLHYNITEEMLKGIFEPFGKVDDVKLMKDHETGRSHGYGFLTFRNPDDAKKAMEQLNGFELAGRPIKVGNVTERSGSEGGPFSNLDTDEMDRAGIGLGATGRLQLMAKLAEGTGFKIPQYAANALNQANNPPSLMSLNLTPPASALPMVPTAAPPPPSANPSSSSSSQPPIATQCFMLSNMFDLTSDKAPNWDQEIRDDVIEECNKHGGVLHIFVDKTSPQGNVYIKCPTISAAAAAVNSLHGRYFGGRVITAAYVPLPNYSSLFMDSIRATQLLLPSSGNPALLPIPPSLR